MSLVKIVAEKRSEFGKGAARRYRRAGQVPAVLYSNTVSPIHVVLPGHDVFLANKRQITLWEIEIDGKSKFAVVKEYQKDPVSRTIEHVDLLVITKKAAEKLIAANEAVAKAVAE